MHDPALPSPSVRPPTLARLHNQPTAHGLTIPYITLRHRGDNRPVWGAIDPVRLHRVWARRLCQVCCDPLTDHKPLADHDRVVVMVRPLDWTHRLGPEPGLHPECARYSTRGCPALNGVLTHYRSHPAVARTYRCSDPTCHCAAWQPADPAQDSVRAGKPLGRWYALWLEADQYRIRQRPGDAGTPTLTGVDLRHVHPLAIRKVRDASPEPGNSEHDAVPHRPRRPRRRDTPEPTHRQEGLAPLMDSSVTRASVHQSCWGYSVLAAFTDRVRRDLDSTRSRRRSAAVRSSRLPSPRLRLSRRR